MASAGQRNCQIAVDECISRYSIDDVLWAVRDYLQRRANDFPRESAEGRTLRNSAAELEQMRGWIGGIQLQR